VAQTADHHITEKIDYLMLVREEGMHHNMPGLPLDVTDVTTACDGYHSWAKSTALLCCWLDVKEVSPPTKLVRGSPQDLAEGVRVLSLPQWPAGEGSSGCDGHHGGGENGQSL